MSYLFGMAYKTKESVKGFLFIYFFNNLLKGFIAHSISSQFARIHDLYAEYVIVVSVTF